MEWSTHALSGVISGYIVTGGDWRGAVVGGVAGVIPDLDEHKSKFGKILFPLSFLLNRLFGHRTFTHSLLFVFLMSGILFAFTEKWLWLATFAGILAHIVGDMLTGTVKLLYPLNKSVGLKIHPSLFKVINSATRLVLLVGILIILLQHLPINSFKGVIGL